MKKTKMILAGICILGVLAGGVFGWYAMRNWPLRFHRELDAFFGEGRWRVLSQDVETSRMYRVYQGGSQLYGDYRPGKYHEWKIGAVDSQGRETVWVLSDHAYRIRRSRKQLFARARDGFARELLDCAMTMAGEELRETVLGKLLSQEERDCLRVTVSYRGGNPKNCGDILKKPWFTADKVDAGHFLETDFWEFYIDIFAYDYRVNTLSEEKKDHLLGSLSEIQQALRDAYGDAAAYEIYLDPEHRADSRTEEK